MAKVLIVDDESCYRERLSEILALDQHETAVARSGREAIDIGVGYRPDVLVTDWMLRLNLHGLHVLEALRVVRSDMQSILITGFASEDLESDAQSHDVFRVLVKPFELQEIRDAVRQATQFVTLPRRPRTIGFIELSPEGKIRFANDHARQMFHRIQGHDQQQHFTDLLSSSDLLDLDAAETRWKSITPRSAQHAYWHVRAQPKRPDGSRWVVLLMPNDPHYQNRKLVETLLDVEEPKVKNWPFTHHALIVDADPAVRKLSIARLESAGATCYASDSIQAACRLLDVNENIRIVLINHDSVTCEEFLQLKARNESLPNRLVMIETGSRPERRCGDPNEILLPRWWCMDELLQAIETTGKDALLI